MSQRIVGFVASRFTLTRSHFIRCMLASVANQTQKLDYLCVGFSFDSTEEMVKYKPTILKILSPEYFGGTQIVCYLSETPLTQGHMWHKMHNEMKPFSSENNWYLFGDDDDIWNPNRVYEYAHHLATLPRRTIESITDIRCPVEVESRDGLYETKHFFFESAEQVDSIRECNGGIRKNSLLQYTNATIYPIIQAMTQTEFDEQSTQWNEKQTTGNYVDHVVKERIFDEFLQLTNASVVYDHPFYDTALRRFLQGYKGKHGGKNVTIFPMVIDNWMYYYRRHHSSATTDYKKRMTKSGEVTGLLLLHFGLPLDKILDHLKSHPIWTSNSTTADVKQFRTLALQFLQKCPMAVHQLYLPNTNNEGKPKVCSKGKKKHKHQKKKRARHNN